MVLLFLRHRALHDGRLDIHFRNDYYVSGPAPLRNGVLTLTCDRGAVLVTPGNGTDLPLRHGSNRRFRAGVNVVIKVAESMRSNLRW